MMPTWARTRSSGLWHLVREQHGDWLHLACGAMTETPQATASSNETPLMGICRRCDREWARYLVSVRANA